MKSVLRYEFNLIKSETINYFNLDSQKTNNPEQESIETEIGKISCLEKHIKICLDNTKKSEMQDAFIVETENYESNNVKKEELNIDILCWRKENKNTFPIRLL